MNLSPGCSNTAAANLNLGGDDHPNMSYMGSNEITQMGPLSTCQTGGKKRVSKKRKVTRKKKRAGSGMFGNIYDSLFTKRHQPMSSTSSSDEFVELDLDPNEAPSSTGKGFKGTMGVPMQGVEDPSDDEADSVYLFTTEVKFAEKCEALRKIGILPPGVTDPNISKRSLVSAWKRSAKRTKITLDRSVLKKKHHGMARKLHTDKDHGALKDPIQELNSARDLILKGRKKKTSRRGRKSNRRGGKKQKKKKSQKKRRSK
jgi:hypothetical protein